MLINFFKLFEPINTMQIVDENTKRNDIENKNDKINPSNIVIKSVDHYWDYQRVNYIFLPASKYI